MTTRDFSNTREALKEFDRTAAERNAAWQRVESNADVDAADAADKAALEKVQRAFHQDTADINSLDNCLRTDIDFMRRMANLNRG